MNETQIREAVRSALNEYRVFLKEKLTTSYDHDHWITSLTQVESALRVLWMEN